MPSGYALGKAHKRCSSFLHFAGFAIGLHWQTDSNSPLAFLAAYRRHWSGSMPTDAGTPKSRTDRVNAAVSVADQLRSRPIDVAVAAGSRVAARYWAGLETDCCWVLLYVHKNRRLIRDGSRTATSTDFHTAPESLRCGRHAATGINNLSEIIAVSWLSVKPCVMCSLV